MHPFLQMVLMPCLLIILLALLVCLYRFIIGPSLVDRLLALDCMFLCSTCLVIVLGIYWSTPYLFEIGLLMAMLGFITTVVLARYFTSGSVID